MGTSVGERIAAWRRQRGMSQSALAAATGVSRSAVAQWETGRSGQVGSNLAQIAAILGVGVDHLLLGGGGEAVAAEMGWLDGVAGDELAMIRLYRSCNGEDRQALLALARRFAGAK